jgi:nucleoside 2-deoxyribosyltransferase
LEPPSAPYEERPLVYIAGPYTLPDPVANTNGVIELASELIDEGLVTPLIPHLTLLWHLVSPRPLDFWYAYDVALLRRCDALFRIEGASSGADMEVDFAGAHGIPVFTNRDDLTAWAVERLRVAQP